jgi:ribosomal protein S18 acetylase RimI-like enzyme
MTRQSDHLPFGPRHERASGRLPESAGIKATALSSRPGSPLPGTRLEAGRFCEYGWVGIELGRPAAGDYDVWAARAIAGYAAEIAASGALGEEAAWDKARRDHERALPNGLDTPGQLIFRLLDGSQPIGWLWLAVPYPNGDPSMAWVYAVEVDEAFRGRGYGREAMLLAETEARARGMRSLGLNVHGSNAIARSLYTSLGYHVTMQQMKKTI